MNNLKLAGLSILSAAAIAFGCSEQKSTEPRRIDDCYPPPAVDTVYVHVPADTVHAPADTVYVVATVPTCQDTTAIDLCTPRVTWKYEGNIPGITGFTIEEKTKDTCGYIAAQGPAIIGALREYQITGLQGDPAAVEANSEKYVNDIITVQFWPKDSQRRNASIVWPGNATQIEVIIGEISNSRYGIGQLLNNGILDVSVDIFGQRLSVRQSGTQYADIVNPDLMSYRIPALPNQPASIEFITDTEFDDRFHH